MRYTHLIILLALLAVCGVVFKASGQAAEAPGEAVPFRIAILGCLRQDRPAPALLQYVEAKPDLCVWLGDNIYADTQTDPKHIERCYEQLAGLPGFAELRAKPTMATWDDHDYGDNNEGMGYPLKEQARGLFRSFWKLESEIPESQPGIYWSRVYHHQRRDIQVIMLDVRWNRGKPDTGADMLGEKQWQWLEGELHKPADLRLIVSGTQLLLEKEAGSETWDQYPESRGRLFSLIRASAAQRVVFLTGDQHYGEVCRERGALGYDAIELQFAGINQTEKPEFNPKRVSACALGLHSHALLDVHLESDKHEPAHIMFRVFDSETGQVEIAYRVNLSEIELTPDASIPAIVPAQREDKIERHERFNAISREGKARLVFLGDSITQGWEGEGKEVWAERFEPRQAANFGISGDRTEHLLWRIDHGNFAGLSPDLIVLHIGTNNTRHRLDTPGETASGVRAILDRLRIRCPDAKVLLLGIFPRGEDEGDPYRRLNQKVNAILATFADDRRVFYRDITGAFLLPDDAPQADPSKPKRGRIRPGMMPDHLHLSSGGYKSWADAIEGDVRRLMNE